MRLKLFNFVKFSRYPVRVACRLRCRRSTILNDQHIQPSNYYFYLKRVNVKLIEKFRMASATHLRFVYQSYVLLFLSLSISSSVLYCHIYSLDKFRKWKYQKKTPCVCIINIQMPSICFRIFMFHRNNENKRTRRRNSRSNNNSTLYL